MTLAIEIARIRLSRSSSNTATNDALSALSRVNFTLPSKGAAAAALILFLRRFWDNLFYCFKNLFELLFKLCKCGCWHDNFRHCLTLNYRRSRHSRCLKLFHDGCPLVKV